MGRFLFKTVALAAVVGVIALGSPGDADAQRKISWKMQAAFASSLAHIEALKSTDEARRDAIDALLNGTPEEQSAAQDVLDDREQQLEAALEGSGLPESEKRKIRNGFIEDRQIEKASLYVRSSDRPLLAVKEVFEGTASIGGEDIRKGISSERLEAWRSRLLEEARAAGRDKRAQLKLQEDIADDAFDKNMNDFVMKVANGDLSIEDGLGWMNRGLLRPIDYQRLSNQAAATARAEESHVASVQDREVRIEDKAADDAFDKVYGDLLRKDLVDGNLTVEDVRAALASEKLRPSDGAKLLKVMSIKDRQKRDEEMAMKAVMAGDITRPDQVLNMGLSAAANRRIIKQLETKLKDAEGNFEDREFNLFLRRLHEGRLTKDAVLETPNSLSNEQKTWFLNEIEDRDEKREEDRIDFIVEDTQNRIDEGGVSVEYVMGLDIPPDRKQDILKHLDNQMEADENARALEFHQRLTAGEDPVAVRKSLDSAFLGGAITRKQYTDLRDHIDTVVQENRGRQGVTIPDAKEQARHYRRELRSMTGAKSPLMGKWEFQKTESNALRAQVMNHYNEMLTAGVPVKLAYAAGARMWNKNRWILHDFSQISELQDAVRRRLAERDNVEDINTIQIDAGTVMIGAIMPPAIVITNGLIDVDATRLRMMNQNNDGILSDNQLLEIDEFLKDLP